MLSPQGPSCDTPAGRNRSECAKSCDPFPEIVPIAADITSGHFEFDHTNPIQFLLSMGVCRGFGPQIEFTLFRQVRSGVRGNWRGGFHGVVVCGLFSETA